jgi:hypothetical protein
MTSTANESTMEMASSQANGLLKSCRMKCKDGNSNFSLYMSQLNPKFQQKRMLRVAPIRDPRCKYGDWEEYEDIEGVKEGAQLLQQRGDKGISTGDARVFYFNRKTFEASYETPSDVLQIKEMQTRPASAFDFSYTANSNNYLGYYDSAGTWVNELGSAGLEMGDQWLEDGQTPFGQTPSNQTPFGTRKSSRSFSGMDDGTGQFQMLADGRLLSTSESQSGYNIDVSYDLAKPPSLQLKRSNSFAVAQKKSNTSGGARGTASKKGVSNSISRSANNSRDGSRGSR